MSEGKENFFQRRTRNAVGGVPERVQLVVERLEQRRKLASRLEWKRKREFGADIAVHDSFRHVILN